MAINAKTLKKHPITSQPTAWVPVYPFFIEIIKQASPHIALMTSTNIQLEKSIIAMGSADLFKWRFQRFSGYNL